jgi:hypothetical protein
MRACIVAYAIIVSLLDAAHAKSCLREIDVKPNESREVAFRGENAPGVWTSTTIQLFATVRTEDGKNQLRGAWIRVTDVFRWGVNYDARGSLGPVVDFSERFSIWGKGGARFIVKAAGSPTRLCVCSAADLDDLPSNYVLRRDQCKREARQTMVN